MPRYGKKAVPIAHSPFRTVLLLILAAGIFMSGCNALGSYSLKKSHRRYEQGLAELRGHELLKSIVKIRYRDLIAFLDVSSITANFTMGANISGNAPVGTPASYAGNLVPLAAGIQAVENPTITFSPLYGSQFVKRMCSPMNIETIFLLSNSGWSVERVLLLTLAMANGLDNASQTYDRGLLDLEPCSREFFHLAELMNRLSVQQKVSWQFCQENMDAGLPPRAFVLVFKDPEDADARDVKRLLNLPQHLNRFYVYYDNILNTAPDREESMGEILVMTRSMNQVLFYLSNGVEVPGKHIEKGLVGAAASGDDGSSRWRDLSGDLFTVHCSSVRPTNAYIMVYHRDHWFYIRDDDVESKVTLLLLQILIDLQAGTAPAQTPVLTLPVSR